MFKFIFRLQVAFGRPSLLQAYLWSLALHAGAAAATCCWWPSPMEQITLAGMRQVVQIESAFAAERTERLEEPVQAEPVLEAPVVVRECDAAPSESLAEALEQATVEVSAPLQVESIPISKSSPMVILPHAPAANEMEFANAVAAIPRSGARRTDDSPDDPLESATAETRFRLPRRVAEVSMPETSVAAEQVAGVEDKTPLDFSNNRPPAYPATALARSLQGTVLLRLHIAATGRVERVEIAASSGHDVLDRAAVEAVSTWRGRPAHQGGMPLASVELLPIRFRL